MTSKAFGIKLDRICAWSLVAFMLIYFVSGYGMTKGIIPPVAAKFIHDSLLPIPSAFAFGFHSAYGIHVALKRWRVYNHAWRIGLGLYVIALTAGVIVFQVAIATPGSTPVEPVRIDL